MRKILVLFKSSVAVVSCLLISLVSYIVIRLNIGLDLAMPPSKSRKLLDPSMEDLPGHVIVDILSRLPVKTIIHCKCVCKKWLDLVSDSYFANLHLSARSPAGFIIHHYSREEKAIDTVTGILRLMEVEDELDHHHLLHNPITSLDLNHREGIAEIVYFFGVGSLTQEYKVIRIFQRNIPHDPTSTSRPSLLEAEVYTLGTGQWRSLGHVPYLDNRFDGSFFNGHAHWTVLFQDSPNKIYAFDFDKETFELFPSPPSESGDYFPSLGVINGCLCQCDTYESKLIVWVMKEYGINNSWHKELVIEKIISPVLNMLWDQTIYLIEGFKDGTILMGISLGAMFIYCPRRKTIVDTEIFGGFIDGLAYRPSFLRLHNFENERVHLL
ncbi:unnamed protein product [Lactuca virosa]|uniref:F-box domain-containing protein n=1 Tax=Lactuca virosa TaxID=75947 RepID=A0AAU9P3Q2_9ASTR|nr:unnamed protein product [Lactuca virosa]